jgi:hemerythrin
MEVLRRKQELSVGVKILDLDHREMEETISDICSLVKVEQDRSLTGPLLRKLAHFTLSHFALEEEMMTATTYPGLAAHRFNHRCLMGQLGKLIAGHDRGALILDPHSLNFLSKWHSAHILHDDRHYGFWLNRVDRRLEISNKYVENPARSQVLSPLSSGCTS